MFPATSKINSSLDSKTSFIFGDLLEKLTKVKWHMLFALGKFQKQKNRCRSQNSNENRYLWLCWYRSWSCRWIWILIRFKSEGHQFYFYLLQGSITLSSNNIKIACILKKTEFVKLLQSISTLIFERYTLISATCNTL